MSITKVKNKIEMLDSLLEIEVAYNLISDKEMSDGKDPIDAHYEKLKTEISVLDRESEEFKVILVKNNVGDLEVVVLNIRVLLLWLLKI